jgi:ubiquitin-like 1-activating enzyme E1 B
MAVTTRVSATVRFFTMAVASHRSDHSLAILGQDLHEKLPITRVLLVGAGGIGCELCQLLPESFIIQKALNDFETVKNITLAGFGHITLLDLDTIDLSNLNRQFLFRKKDVKQSKAFVSSQAFTSPDRLSSHRPTQIAARTAQQFNPHVTITPLHANIKDPQFDMDWFKSFHLVLNALDNLGNLVSSIYVFFCMFNFVPFFQ